MKVKWRWQRADNFLGGGLWEAIYESINLDTWYPEDLKNCRSDDCQPENSLGTARGPHYRRVEIQQRNPLEKGSRPRAYNLSEIDF
jgi:hypothetical protein